MWVQSAGSEIDRSFCRLVLPDCDHFDAVIHKRLRAHVQDKSRFSNSPYPRELQLHHAGC